MLQIQKMELTAEVKQYMARIGRNGGSRSKRKLTKREARRMAAVRWHNQKQRLISAQPQAIITNGN